MFKKICFALLGPFGKYAQGVGTNGMNYEKQPPMAVNLEFYVFRFGRSRLGQTDGGRTEDGRRTGGWKCGRRVDGGKINLKCDSILEESMIAKCTILADDRAQHLGPDS